jgi:hypothetical protein
MRMAKSFAGTIRMANPSRAPSSLATEGLDNLVSRSGVVRCTYTGTSLRVNRVTAKPMATIA